MDWFWFGCAAAMKKGLEILGISIVDADVKDAVFLKAEQTTASAPWRNFYKINELLT